MRRKLLYREKYHNLLRPDPELGVAAEELKTILKQVANSCRDKEWRLSELARTIPDYDRIKSILSKARCEPVEPIPGLNAKVYGQHNRTKGEQPMFRLGMLQYCTRMQLPTIEPREILEKVEEARILAKEKKYAEALEKVNIAVIEVPCVTKNDTSSEFERASSRRTAQEEPDDKIEIYAEGSDAPIVKALWLRSAILMSMKKYDLALQDLLMIKKLGLATELKPLYQRRIKSAQKGLKPSIFGKLTDRVHDTLLKYKTSKYRKARTYMSELSFGVPEYNKQTQIFIAPNISHDDTPENGPHCVVTRAKYNVGDILIKESPFASCLLPDFYETHCLNCYKIVEAPYGCNNCTDVRYCSLSCHEIGSKYHQYECGFVHIWKATGLSTDCLLAMRMLTLYGFEECEKMYKEFVAIKPISDHDKYFADFDQDFQNEEQLMAKKVTSAVIVEAGKSTEAEPIASTSAQAEAREQLERFEFKYDDLPMDMIRIRLPVFGPPKDEDDLEDEIVCEPTERKCEPQKIKEIFNSTANGKQLQKRIYNLPIHAEKLNSVQFVKTVAISAFVLDYIRRHNFLTNDENGTKIVADANGQTIMLDLLQRNLRIVRYHAREIFEINYDPKISLGVTTVTKAIGVYGSSAFLKHDCYPNTARFFDGKELTIRAFKHMEAGEILTDSYGPTYINSTMYDRTRYLQERFNINCECETCMNDWTAIEKLTTAEPTIFCYHSRNRRCKTPRILIQLEYAVCFDCYWSVRPNLTRYMTSLGEKLKDSCKKLMGEASVENVDIEETTIELSYAINSFFVLSRGPYKPLHAAEEILKFCYSKKQETPLLRLYKRRAESRHQREREDRGATRYEKFMNDILKRTPPEPLPFDPQFEF